MSAWKEYEEVAAKLLARFAPLLGLSSVEGKQELEGNATTWEIDAKGIREGGRGILVIECRRRPSSRQSQKDLAALAFQIQDVGAEGGILVSPLPLQEGAKRIASAANIISVQMSGDSTPTEYLVSFLNHLMVGVEDEVQVEDSIEVVLRDRNGNVVQGVKS